jgi:hypothetical protein
MRQRWRFGTLTFLLTLLVGGISGGGAQKQSDNVHLVPVSRGRLCVTKGAIGEVEGPQLEVKVPEMRAVADYPTESVAEAKFTYLGHTKTDKPLASGELRRQFGLKLRAENGCNLVYAMWSVEPTPGLRVLLKRNPGMTTHAQCGAKGYHTLRPTRDIAAPELREGEEHTLRAAINDGTLRIWIDGTLHWEGLAHDALSFNGPSGIRSDNGRFTFEFLSSAPAGHGEAKPCHSSPDEED